MKTTKMLTILVLALGLIVWSAKVSKAAPMGTGFTYQGRLIDANNAANGLYDFAFKLYDANVAGTQKGSTIDVNELDVIDGYFTVLLDFGGDVFNGDARWLEIGVRPGNLNDPNAYTTLSPRQRVTPTPYALQTRGIFVDNAGNVGIGTANPGSKLEVIGNAHIGTSAASAFPNAKLFIDGSAAAPATSGTTTTALTRFWSGSTNITLDTGLMLASPYGAWLQVTNSTDLSQTWPLLLNPNGGNVGIGTTKPTYKLDVEGDVQAYAYHTGDIFFQKDGQKLWRMFEDEDGVYLENLKTGKIYSFVLKEAEINDNVNFEQTMRDLWSENEFLKERVENLERTMQRILLSVAKEVQQ